VAFGSPAKCDRSRLYFLRLGEDWTIPVYVSPTEQDEALDAIDKERKKERATGVDPHEIALKGLDRTKKELDNLTKLRYRDLIEDEEFVRQRAELLRQQASLKQRMAQLRTERWIKPSQNLFLFSNRAIFWLTHGGLSERRLILATVGSNPTLMSKKLNIHACYPFMLLAKPRDSCDWWAIVNDVRTFFLENPDVEIPLLPEPDSEFNLAA
jgi:hypothetical protein